MQQRIHVYLVIIAAILCGMLLFCSLLGRGHLDYFSPDTLELKTQSELLFPRTDVSIFRSRPDYHRNELIEFLIADGYWSPRTTNVPRWFLTNHSSDQWYDGHSDLHRQLVWEKSFWREWSVNHPEIAAVLWPLILEILRASEDSFDDGLAAQILFHAKEAMTLDEFKTLIANDPELQSIAEFKK